MPFPFVMIAMRIVGESVATRCTLLTLLFLTIEGDADTSGLSTGPLNPADIGSRCAVMAGRIDRAYLDCAQQVQQPAAATQRHNGTFLELPRLDDGGGRSDRETGRYPVRRR